MKHTLIGILVLVVITSVGYFFYTQTAHAPVETAGNESGVNPATSDFIYVNASGDTIRVDEPVPNAVVGKTFSVAGSARGVWYFEASFPVEVTAPDGTVLAQLPATANGDWMTNDFVPYIVSLKITNGYTGPATVTLKKDNPSGEPERDASVSFSVVIQ